MTACRWATGGRTDPAADGRGGTVSGSERGVMLAAGLTRRAVTALGLR